MGNSRDGNKTPYRGMIDGRNSKQRRRDGSETRGLERKRTWFPVPVPYRARSGHIFPSRRFSPYFQAGTSSYEALYRKGGNEERDRHLQVAKLLTALSCCVGSSFIFLRSSISFRIAFTVKRCVSAKKSCILVGRVWLGGYGLLVGEWVLTASFYHYY